MKHLGRVFLLLAFLTTGQAFAACGCEATAERCEEATLQTAVKTTHEQPIMHAATERSFTPQQAIVWALVIATAVVLLRRRNRVLVLP